MLALGALLVVAVGAGAASPPRLLRGAYPDFEAPIYRAPTEAWSVCDVTAAPWSAAGDGHMDDTAALQGCITMCPRGTDGSFAVVLKAGKKFLTGALNLTSGCHLIVDGILLGSTNPASYPVIPPLAGYGPGQRDKAVHGWGRHQALISGWNMHDVVVAGSGVIDGQGLVADPQLGSSWVTRFKGQKLDFGRPRIWEPMFSRRVSLVNVSITNQAFWAVHPYACDDVYIGHVNISAPRDEGIPNDDGIDPDSTGNLLVEDCWVSVGDNSVAIKSGMNWYGRQLGRASYNQVYRDSTFTCETFAIGSEMSGGVFNITVDNCIFGTDATDFAGLHFKAPRLRGGSIHSVVVKDSVFHLETSTKNTMPISASMFYGSNGGGPGNESSTPKVYGCHFSNLSIYMPPKAPAPAGVAARVAAAAGKSTGQSFQFLGLPESVMHDFRFEDITVLSGHSQGWQCVNTSHFSFVNVHPAPTAESGCL